MNPITMQQYGQERIARARAQADMWRELERAVARDSQDSQVSVGWIANIWGHVHWSVRRLGTRLLPSVSAGDK
jgi:hypothetical protein